MISSRFLLPGLLALCSPCALAQTSRLSSIPFPDSRVEAQIAQELALVAPAVLSAHAGSDATADKRTLALAFARLGRTGAALQVAKAMDGRKQQFMLSEGST